MNGILETRWIGVMALWMPKTGVTDTMNKRTKTGVADTIMITDVPHL